MDISTWHITTTSYALVYLQKLQNLKIEMQEYFTYKLEVCRSSTVPAPTELKTQHIYEFSTSDAFPLDPIPLAVDHRINHKYPNLINLPILSMAHRRLDIPRSTVFVTLKPIEIENADISDISLIKIEKSNENTVNNLEELHHHSQTANEIPTIPSQSSSAWIK